MLRLKSPLKVILLLTRKCNVHCAHCSIPELPNRGNELSTREFLALLESLAECEVKIIVLSGGEPLLHPDFFLIGKTAVELGFFVTTSSNGLILSDEVADHLANIGVHHVQISVDGPPEFHDNFRGQKGLYNKAVEAIRRCLVRNISVSLMCTVSKMNARYVPEVIQLARSLEVTCAFERLIPVGRGRKLSHQILYPSEFKSLLQTLIYEGENVINNRMVSCEDPLMNVLKLPKWAKNGIESGGCIAGTVACAISSNGDVFPCQNLPVVLGNIRSKTLKEIWQTSNVIALLCDRQNLIGKCRGCRYKSICGGCRAHAYAKFGNFLASDPMCFL